MKKWLVVVLLLAVGCYGAHSVTIGWKYEPSAEYYNVYRSEKHGGPYEFRASTRTVFYRDLEVRGGHMYYYVITSVDSSGTESGYSAEVVATVPRTNSFPTTLILSTPKVTNELTTRVYPRGYGLGHVSIHSSLHR